MKVHFRIFIYRWMDIHNLKQLSIFVTGCDSFQVSRHAVLSEDDYAPHARIMGMKRLHLISPGERLAVNPFLSKLSGTCNRIGSSSKMTKIVYDAHACGKI